CEREASCSRQRPRGERTPGPGGGRGRWRDHGRQAGQAGVPQAAPSGASCGCSGPARPRGGCRPSSSGLRKQKSLTNLCVLTDAEKKLQLYQPKWCDDMAKPSGGGGGRGQPEGRKAQGGRRGPLSRNLSKSEHSLFQGKAKPFGPLAAPAGLGKPSRIPRGPYAEVKPLSKAPDGPDNDSKSDDEILSSKAKASEKKKLAESSAAVPPVGDKGVRGPEEGDKAFLKVDPELVVTVLGDLEQLLFSQILDPESQRKRTVQNVLDLRQNLEDTMSSLRGSQLSHSCLETGVCYDSDEANARSVSSTSNRSSRSPGAAPVQPAPAGRRRPSSTGRVPEAGRGRAVRLPHHARPRAPRRGHASRLELIQSLEADDPELKPGYLGDCAQLTKSLPDEEEEEEEEEDDDDDLANG
ncbi:hypothetical protein ANANG_G00216110, partial [Anguilla anguilla]